MALAKAVVGQLVKRPAPLNGLVKQSIPPLESGDRLTRAEFERRYHAMPPHIRAELIEGVVYISSPVRHRQHGKPQGRLVHNVVEYVDHTAGTDYSDNATVRLDLANEPQPDIALFLETQLGGQLVETPDGYLAGSPELVIEIAASTTSVDMHAKLNAYRRNRVQEYIVWRTLDGELDWFHLQDEQYVRLPMDDKGIICSRVFPGLWLNVKALLRGDVAKVRATSEQGIKSKEHAAFVRELQRRAQAKR
jgi:Uma2 family endonuclease